MAKDYYSILGVGKSAGTEEIKKAYRKQALKHHPDKGGDQAKFKEINEAYQVLSNPQKRAQYDQFGEAGVGGGAGGSYGGYSGFDGGNYEDIFRGGGFGFGGGLGDIFEDFFGAAFSQVQAEVKIKFYQAVLGETIELKTSDGQKLSFKIPAGTQDGQSFRFPGKGKAYRGGRGDLIVTVRVEIPHRISREEKELFEKLKALDHQKQSWKFWQ